MLGHVTGVVGTPDVPEVVLVVVVKGSVVEVLVDVDVRLVLVAVVIDVVVKGHSEHPLQKYSLHETSHPPLHPLQTGPIPIVS